MHEITNKGDPTVNIVAFEVQMLALLGYLPELNRCVNCKEKVISKSISYFSALEGGGMICSDCGRKIREKVKISGDTIATINYLIDRKIQNTGRLSIHSFLQNEIKKVLRYYLSFILNKKLKMWRYI